MLATISRAPSVDSGPTPDSADTELSVSTGSSAGTCRLNLPRCQRKLGIAQKRLT